MPWLPGNCPNCGGILQIDSSKDAAICEHCGTPFIVEKAINIYNNATIYAQNVTINNSVETPKPEFDISVGVLKHYTGASSVINIPEGVVAIERGCFGGTPDGSVSPASITQVYIPSTLQNSNFAFLGCKLLYRVVIAEGVTNLGVYMFKECWSLREVIIPNSVKEIHSSAFAESGLVSVNIPQYCIVHALAFGKCSSLAYVNIAYPIIVEGMTGFLGGLEQVIIQNENELREYFIKYRNYKYLTPFADSLFMCNVVRYGPQK